MRCFSSPGSPRTPMDSVRDGPCGPGFPIRRSTDQSLLTAPRGLSQRATSFIASRRQGIHQTPFSARDPHPQTARRQNPPAGKGAPRRRQPCAAALGRAAPHRLRNQETHHARQRTTCPNQCLLTISETALPARAGQANRRRRAKACLLETWWSRTGSNRRPPACKAGALPTELRPLPGRRPPPRGGGVNAAIRNLRRVSAAEARTTVEAGERGISGGPG